MEWEKDFETEEMEMNEGNDGKEEPYVYEIEDDDDDVEEVNPKEVELEDAQLHSDVVEKSTSNENLSTRFSSDQEKAIRAAVHYTVGQICEEVGTEYGLIFSKPVIATISEFINRQFETYALDLEAFAKHAHRTTINCDDVILLVRRNTKLKDLVQQYSETLKPSTSGAVKRKRKKSKPKDASGTKS